MPDRHALERYAEEHTTPDAAPLRALAEETRATLDSPEMLSGPVVGRLLELLAWVTGAERVLEIGTFSGYGALSLAAGLGPEGRVVTLELDPQWAAVARRHVRAGPHPERVEVRVGRALDLLEDLPGPWDLVFIDADKTSYAEYYEAVLGRLAPRGLIAVDNTLRGGRVIDPDDESTLAIASFNDMVRDDPRVRCVLLTVRDGLTLIRRA